jgi:hypothetical protein
VNNVLPGVYSVVESVPAGWGLVSAVCSDASPADAIAVGPGETVTCAFTNTTLAVVGDRAWEDIDPDAPNTPARLAGDGLQNSPAEPGVGGITVELWSAGADGIAGASTEAGGSAPSASAVQGGDDVRVATTTTGGDGDYRFEGVLPGDYFLVFVKDATLPLAWSTKPNVGADDAIDSDVTLDANDPNRARTPVLALAAGAVDLTWDAALVNVSGADSADLGDRVWRDTSRNGIQDVGEPGEPGVTVRLYVAGSSTPLATTTTDAQGLYFFAALDAGPYVVEFVLPQGFVFTPRDAGSDDAVDSDADPATGRTATIALADNTADLTWDAGIALAPTNDPEGEPAGRLYQYLPNID